MSDPQHATHDPLGRLIHDAGPRAAPPVQARERALRAATDAWRATLRRRRWRRRGALAACVAIVAVGIAVLIDPYGPEPVSLEPVAQVARVIGEVRARSLSSGEWSALPEGSALQRGAAIRTDSAAAVALQVGPVSVRLARDTELIVESSSRLRLLSGKVYLDTGADGAGPAMLVVTEAGSVADLGTQFEVSVQGGRYRVRVREGQVLLRRGEQRLRGAAGEQIDVGRDGVVSVTRIAQNDPAWSWAQALASAPQIDDQPLSVLVAWVARETGLAVRYATPAAERKARATILHGSIRGLEPLEALGAMLATTDLRHEVLADGTIMIR